MRSFCVIVTDFNVLVFGDAWGRVKKFSYLIYPAVKWWGNLTRVARARAPTFTSVLEGEYILSLII